MNQLINHPQFGDIRVETIKNEPWFCAKDICDILGYTNSRKTISDHCNAKGVTNRYILTNGGNQEMAYINEGNLYRLMIKSQKPIARKFESWVCDEVLPSIRKYGTYSTDERTMDRAIKRAEARTVKNLLTEINQTLSGTDKRIIAKQCLTDEYEVQQVLNGRKEDVHMMSLLYARATGNKKYRGAFYSLEGAEQLLNELLKTNDKENSNHY